MDPMTCPACSRPLERTSFGTTRLCRCGHEGVEMVREVEELNTEPKPSDAEVREYLRRNAPLVAEASASLDYMTPADLGRREEKKPEILDEVGKLTPEMLAELAKTPPLPPPGYVFSLPPTPDWVKPFYSTTGTAPAPAPAQERGAKMRPCWHCGGECNRWSCFCDGCGQTERATGSCLRCGKATGCLWMCPNCLKEANAEVRAPGFVPRRERR